MAKIVTVDFHGDRLLGIESERGALVYMKPIVEQLGLDWSAQLRRIKRDPILREGMAVMATPPEFGGDNEAVFLALELFHGWLFKLTAARVREDLRSKLITYQREAHAVLAQAFGVPRQPAPEPIAAPGPIDTIQWDPARKLVAEVRHLFGDLAGRQLYFKLGLPTVPAMYGAPVQLPLFTYTAHPDQGGRP